MWQEELMWCYLKIDIFVKKKRSHDKKYIWSSLYNIFVIIIIYLPFQPFNSQDFMSNSPFCLPYNLCG